MFINASGPPLWNLTKLNVAQAASQRPLWPDQSISQPCMKAPGNSAFINVSGPGSSNLRNSIFTNVFLLPEERARGTQCLSMFHDYRHRSSEISLFTNVSPTGCKAQGTQLLSLFQNRRHGSSKTRSLPIPVNFFLISP
jgi:hypothetical protein